jgi:hypothetical protein
MNKTSVQLVAKIKSLLEEIVPGAYNVDTIKNIYEYPAQLIPSFPAITVALNSVERTDETLGDERFLERYNVEIRVYISLIDSKENYISLLNLDRAIRDKLTDNRRIDAYWRNSTLPNSSYYEASIGDAMCRSVLLSWTIEQIVL